MRICQGRCCPAVTPVLCFYFLITYVLLEIVPWQVVFAGWLHFSEVLVCTAQRPAHSVQVPGRDLNARTSSFNLSYHQRTPGPSLVRPLQPSDSKCCTSPCAGGCRSRWLRMQRQNRYFDFQQPAQKQQPRPPSSGGRHRPKFPLI